MSFNSQKRLLPPMSQNNYGYPSQINIYPQMNPEYMVQPAAQSNFQQVNNEVNVDSQDPSLSQVIRQTLETNFFKIPEKFNTCLMEKLQPKFEDHNQKLNECRKEMHTTEIYFEEQMEFLKNKVDKVENQILKWENQTHFLVDQQTENQNLLENYNQENKDKVAQQISLERQREQLLLQTVNEVEMMKFKIQENISIVEKDITSNIYLEEESFREFKTLIIEKLEEVNNEIKNVSIVDKREDDFRFSKKRVDLSISVKKIKEVKNQIDKIKMNSHLKFISKEGFSYLTKNNCKANDSNKFANMTSFLNKTAHVKKRTNCDLAFFNF